MKRFVLERLVARGGASRVFRARDLESGGEVAVKLAGAPGGAAAARLRREAAIVAELDHPRLVRHVAHGEGDEGPWLALDWIDGETVAARLARGPLAGDETLALALGALDALDALHARGLVHGDVAPQNLMLAGGAPDRGILLDFGLAARAGTPASERAATGTPGFLAPERIDGGAPAHPAADLFALGALLHACVAGRPPFAGDGSLGTLARTLFDEPPRLADVAPAAPAALAQLVPRLLARDPALRPDAQAARAALDRALAGRLTPPPPGLVRLGAEARLVSVVLLEPVGDPARAQAIAREHGARAARLPDGALLVVLSSRGAATDRAAAAARCALRLRAAHPDARVTLATGHAARDEAGTGEVAESAARLRAGARAGGGVVLDDLTAELLGPGFDVARAAVVELRGERSGPAGPRTLLGRPSPFAGRERDMGTVFGVLAECVEERRPRALVVTGAAGIGKSRLGHELARRAERELGAQVLIGRGDPLRGEAPWALFGSLLRHAADVRPEQSPAERRAQLAARLGRRLPAAAQARHLPPLALLAGAGDGEGQAAWPDPLNVGDAARLAAVEWLTAEAEAAPLLVVLEDVHWGDGASVRLVEAVLRLAGARPVMALALARPEVSERFPGLWSAVGARTLALRELSQRACERVVRAMVPALAAADVAALVARSGGHPFFLEELIRAAAAGKRAAPPATVLASVATRLEELPAPARRLLAAASVYGERFPARGAARLVGDAHGAETAALLEHLAGEELVAPAGGDERAFRHALVRDAAYRLLADDDRRVAHLHAAEWLASTQTGEDRAIAEHFEAGGAPERALPHRVRDAERALASSDFAGAIERARQARAAGAAGELLGRLHLVEAEALNWLGDHALAEPTALAAMALLPRHGRVWFRAQFELVNAMGRRHRRDELVEVFTGMLDAPPEARRDVGYLAGHLSTWFRTWGMRPETERLERLATAAAAALPDDDALQGAARIATACVRILDGDVALCAEDFHASGEAFERAGDLRQAVLQYANEGFAWATRGRYDEAERVIRGTLAFGERLGLVPVVNSGQQNLGLVLSQLGRHAEALPYLRESAAAYRRDNEPRMAGASILYLANALMELGELHEAEAEARTAVRDLDGMPTLQPLARARLADVLLRQGRAGDALVEIELAQAVVTAGNPVEESEFVVDLVHAQVLLALDRRDEARLVARAGAERLRRRASSIRSDEARHAFLTGPPENPRLLALAAALDPVP